MIVSGSRAGPTDSFSEWPVYVRGPTILYLLDPRKFALSALMFKFLQLSYMTFLC